MKTALRPSAPSLSLFWPTNHGKKISSRKPQLAPLWVVSLLVLAFTQTAMGQQLTPQIATPQPPTPSTVVGDVVINPVTGASETVVQLITDANGQEIDVLTNLGNAIGPINRRAAPQYTKSFPWSTTPRLV